MELLLDERIHSNPRQISSVSGTDCIIAYGAVTGWTNPLEPETWERLTNQFCFWYRLHYSLWSCHWMNESTRTRDSRGELISSVSGTDCIIAYGAVTGWTNPLEPETNQFCFWYRLHYSLWGCHWMNESTRTRDKSVLFLVQTAL